MKQFYLHISNQIHSCDEISELKDGGQREPAKSQSGQIVLEYILLMLLAVSMASLVSGKLIGGTAQDCAQKKAPLLSQMLCNITFAIANDLPSDIEQ